MQTAWLRHLKTDRKAFFARHGKRALWLWVVYQAIKGTLTTSLIWVPLFLYYFNR